MSETPTVIIALKASVQVLSVLECGPFPAVSPILQLIISAYEGIGNSHSSINKLMDSIRFVNDLLQEHQETIKTQPNNKLSTVRLFELNGIS